MSKSCTKHKVKKMSLKAQDYLQKKKKGEVTDYNTKYKETKSERQERKQRKRKRKKRKEKSGNARASTVLQFVSNRAHDYVCK